MTVTTYQGDCLELMDSIPDSSVDMILCDLPYGVLNKGNPNAKWDTVIPFDSLWNQYDRICKPNAAIVLFCQGMFTAELIMSNPSLWRYNLIWEKDRPTGFLNANRMPLRSHEDIAVFYRELPVYNPQMTPCRPSERCHPIGNGKHTDRNQQYGDFDRVHPATVRNVKFPKSVIKIPQEHKCDGRSHPTQKPVALCEYLIRTYTNEGMIILDNCMGSGSTGVACIQSNRDFIGIEKDPAYYEYAQERLSTAQTKGASPIPGRRTLESWGSAE